MPHLSLTDFVDIVSKSGTPKATCIRDVKNRPPYHPAFDFYKSLREHIVDTHTRGRPRRAIGEVLQQLTDTKKVSNYPDAVNGYLRCGAGNRWSGSSHLMGPTVVKVWMLTLIRSWALTWTGLRT
jgi:hypothetical protein